MTKTVFTYLILNFGILLMSNAQSIDSICYSRCVGYDYLESSWNDFEVIDSGKSKAWVMTGANNGLEWNRIYSYDNCQMYKINAEYTSYPFIGVAKVGEAFIKSSKHYNSYIEKVSNFKVQWYLHFFSSQEILITGMCLDNDQNIIVCGNANASFKVAGKNYKINKPSGFIFKFTPNGEVVFNKVISSHNSNIAIHEIHSDCNNALYFTGYFTNNLLIDGVLAKGSNIKNPYVVKLDEKGYCQWIKNFNCDEEASGMSVNLDMSKGNVLSTGYFKGTLEIDTFKFKPKGTTDMFLTLIDRNGEIVNAMADGKDYLTVIGTHIAADDTSIWVSGKIIKNKESELSDFTLENIAQQFTWQYEKNTLVTINNKCNEFDKVHENTSGIMSRYLDAVCKLQ